MTLKGVKSGLVICFVLMFVLVAMLGISTTLDNKLITANAETTDIASVDGTSYSDFQEALDAVNASGGTLKLLSDIDQLNYPEFKDAEIVFRDCSNPISFDLNGHTVDRGIRVGYNVATRQAGYVIGVFSGCKVTILDSSVEKTGKITIDNDKSLDYHYASSANNGIYNAGELTIRDIEISGIEATGGIVLNNGTLNIEDGVAIIGNKSEGLGGGVVNGLNKTLTMTNVLVAGNKADRGAGVYNSGTATINGGEIVGNNVSSDDPSDLLGAGIYNEGTLTFTGDAIVHNNMKDGIFDEYKGYYVEKTEYNLNDDVFSENSDICFASGKNLTFDEDKPFTGKIVLKIAEADFIITKSAPASYQYGAIKIDSPHYRALLTEENGWLKTNGEVYYSYDALLNYVGYASVSEAIAQMNRTGGSLVLLDDITNENYTDFQNNPIHFTKDDVPISIDLNGHSIDRGLTEAKYNGQVIQIDVRSCVTITDSSDEQTGKITGGYAKEDSDNFGDVYAGGIANDGDLTLKGGIICGNKNNVCGGGVYNGGTFTMTGGAIVGNEATLVGGGVYVEAGGEFVMTGGIISGNSSAGLSVSDGADITLGGTATIIGNVLNGILDEESGNYVVDYEDYSDAQNIYLYAGEKITFDETNPFVGEVGLYANPNEIISDVYDSDIHIGNITSDKKYIHFEEYEGTLRSVVVSASVEVDGVVKFYEEFADALNDVNETGGTLKLLDDVNPDIYSGFSSKPIEFKGTEANPVILDLNGCVIDRELDTKTSSGYVIRVAVESGAEECGHLIIRDTSVEQTGTITGGNSSGFGGGILNWGKLTIEGGTITGNKTTSGGAGVYNGSNPTKDATIIMTGGSITNNISYNTTGGGIFNNNGIVIMTGGSITDNIGKQHGGGIYNNGRLTIGGDAVVTGNTIGSSVDIDDGVIEGLKTDNICLCDDKTIDFDDTDRFTGEIGVCLVNRGLGDISTTWNNVTDETAKVTSDVESYGVQANGNTLSFMIRAASVETNGIYKDFELFEDALEYVNTNGGVLTLYADVTKDNYFATSNKIIDFNAVDEANAITFDLNGYTIDKGLTAYSLLGLAIAVQSETNVTIIDSSEEGTGTITGGHDINGGGIFNEGTLVIEGGKIVKNGATKGGGISNYGILTINGGEISGNKAQEKGSGIFNEGTLIINGGIIQGNNITGEESDNFGAIYQSVDAVSLTIGGSAYIVDNVKGGTYDAETQLYTGGTSSNVYLAQNTSITFDSDNPFTGSIGFSKDDLGAISTTWNSAHSGAIISDESGLGLIVNGNELSSISYDDVFASVKLGEQELLYTSFESALAVVNADGGTLKLLADVDVTNYFTTYRSIDFNSTTNLITLDLNGYTIDCGLEVDPAVGQGNVILIESGKNVKIIDSSEDETGTITGGYNGDCGGGIVNEGTLVIEGGTITGNQATKDGGGIYNQGILTIKGGTISNNTATDGGGGIYNAGTLYIEDGSITENTAQYNGGGIHNSNPEVECTLNITGGSITNNVASGGDGGGICDVGEEATTIKNATISGNTSANKGGGIYATFELIISNTSITGNSALVGGGIFGGVSLTLTDVSITGNNATMGSGGVFSGSQTIIYGKTDVIGNVLGGTLDTETNIYTGENTDNISLLKNTITFSGDSDKKFSGNIGVHLLYMNSNTIYYIPGEVSTTWDSTFTGKITSDKDNLAKVIDGTNVSIKNLVAEVTTASGTNRYADFALALDDINANGGELKLLSDINQTTWSAFDSNVIELGFDGIIFDLNGFDIDRELDSARDNGMVIRVSANAIVKFIDTSDEKGGTITGGYSSPDSGGGIYNAGTITIIDVKITGNKAVYGGGIFNKGSLTIGGNTTITGNLGSSGGTHPDNIFFATGKTMAFDTDNEFSGTIAITMQTSGVFSDNTYTSSTAQVTSDKPNYVIEEQNSSYVLLKIMVEVAVGGETIQFSNFIGAVNYADTNGGIVKLLGDTDLADKDGSYPQIIVTGSFTIDLNGCVISCARYDEVNKFVVESDATLHITDLSESGSGELNTSSGMTEGSVLYNNGALTISNITISGNYASMGGAIYNTNTLTINDAILEYNSADIGGAIYNAGPLNILGNTYITNNTASDSDSNIYQTNNGTMNFSEETPFTGSIGVDLESGEGVISYSYTSPHSGTITSDDTSFMVTKSGDVVSLVKKRAEVIFGGNTIGYGTFNDALSFVNANGGKLKLLSDVDLTAGIIFDGTNEEITLDLNGYTIDRGLTSATENGYVIKIGSEKSVIITDTSVSGNGTITGGNNSICGGGIFNEGTLNINNIEISGNTAEHGGGIYSVGGGLSVTNCVIQENEATMYGGGIHSATNNNVTVLGGSITNNVASAYGAGVHLAGDSGTLTIGGGIEITGNKSNGDICNVFIATNKTITFNENFSGNVGITMQTAGKVSTTWDSTFRGTITSDKENLATVIDGTNVSIAKVLAEVTRDSVTTRYADFALALDDINANGGELKLLSDINQTTWSAFADTYIDFSNATSPITFDLNSFTIDRGLSDYTSSGQVINVRENVDLTIIDTSVAKTGKITGGFSNFEAGGIDNEGNLTLINVTITDNIARNIGGGILNKGRLTIGGNTNITGNEMTIGANNILLASDKTIFFDRSNPFSGTIGVSMGTMGEFSTSWYNIFTGKVISDSSSYIVIINGAELSLGIEADAVAKVTIGDRVTYYGIFEQALDMVNEYGGKLTLLSNVTKTSYFEEVDTFIDFTNQEEAITLDLNGYTIDRGLTEAVENGFVMRILNMVNVTITDTSVAKNGVITGGNNANHNNGGGIVNFGTLTFEGGIIAGNKTNGDGGGIYNLEELSITGGKIEYNSASIGGAVYSNVEYDLSIFDATIQYNNAKTSGAGGIYLRVMVEDVIIGGNTKIIDNVVGGTITGDNINGFSLTGGDASNLMFTDEDDRITFDVDNPFVGEIGVSMFVGNISNTWDNVGANAKVTSDDESLFIEDNGGQLFLRVAIASVQVGSSLTKYDDFAQALQKVNADGGRLTLYGDITQSSYTTFANAYIDFNNSNGAIILDLNGYTIDRGLTEAIASGYVIKVSMSAELTIVDSSGDNSGTITGGNNYSGASGGGIFNAGTLTFEGGTIKGNTTLNGGGIYNNSELVIDGGVITNNTATNYGGGIYNPINETLNIISGTITNNNADVAGGIYNWGDFTIKDCEITGNTGRFGGGIYTTKNITMGGATKVINNTNNGVANNIYFSGGSIVVVFDSVDKFTGEIGVNRNGSAGLVSNNWDNNVTLSAKVTSDEDLYTVEADGATLSLLKVVATVTIDSAVTKYGDFAKAIQKVNTDGGTLTLYGDITQSSYTSFANTFIEFTNQDEAIILDLNGYTIDRGLTVAIASGYVIKVSMSVELTIVDSSGDNSGTITGGYNTDNGGGICNYGTLEITNTNITGNNTDESKSSGGGIYNGGKLTINGGSIKYNKAKSAGGIYNNGKLTINDVTITNNTCPSDRRGGGIYNYDSLIIGGNTIITGNVHGGTITNSEGTYTLSGGTVDNIYLADYIITFSTVAGKEFSGNIGIATRTAPTTSKAAVVSTEDSGDASGGTITSDNANFIVVVDGTEVKLKIPVASVTVGTTESYYETFAEALAYVNTNGGILKLFADINASNFFVNNRDNTDDDLINFYNETEDITFDLNGFTIDRGLTTALFKGYSIKVGEGATVSIIDSSIEKTGTITGGYNTSGGGAIRIGNEAKLTINDVTIKDNKSEEYGGAIFTFGSGVLILNGAKITGNTSNDNGGGIFYDTASITTALLTISGNTQITGNTMGDSTNNIYCVGAKKITFTSDFSGSVGITMNKTPTAGSPVVISSVDSSYTSGGTITSDTATSLIATDSTTIKLAYIVAQVTDSNGVITYYTDFETALEEVNANGVTLKIFNDVTEDNYFEDNEAIVFSNTAKAMIFDLNGYTIDRGLTEAIASGYVIKVSMSVELTIVDSSGDNSGTITGGNNSSKTSGGGIFNAGTLTFEGGTITGNTSFNGGGIYNNSELVIDGGVITNNTATNYGGGIYNDKDETLEIISGTITNNNADVGGGIDNWGDFTIKDCEITGNTGRFGGGIYTTKNITMGGATKVINNTNNGVANNIYFSGGSIVIVFDSVDKFTGEIGVNRNGSAGLVSNNWDNNVTLSAKVTSDEDLYTVEADGAILSLLKVVATVTIDSVVTKYSDFAKALQKVNADGGILKLFADINASNFFVNNRENTDDDLINFYNETEDITFDLNGFTIDRGLTTAIKRGYAIKVGEGATVSIIDSSIEKTGTITGGYNTIGGGAIRIENEAKLTINDVTIKDNKSEEYGGAIFTFGSGVLILNGAKITGNISTDNGGGIFYDTASITTALLTISGNTQITGNTMGDSTNNIYCVGAKKITFTSDFSGSVGITTNNIPTAGSPIVISSVDSTYTSGGTITSDTATSLIATDSTTIKLAYIVAQVTDSNGVITYYTDFETALEEVNANGVTLKIFNDVTEDNYFEDNGAIVFSNTAKAMIFDLNGYTIDRELSKAKENGYVVKVSSGVVMMIIDTSVEKTGTITGGNNGGSDTCVGGGIYNAGKLTIQNITIEENTAYMGGGIFVENNARLDIAGTQINNNEAEKIGGGVCVYGESRFTMHSGIITHNTAIGENSGLGGGVAVGGTFTLLGGEISYNNANYGGGVSVFDGGDYIDDIGYTYHGSVTMVDGTINHNTANYAGGGVYIGRVKDNKNDDETMTVTPNTFVMNGGSISNNEALYPIPASGYGGGVYIASEDKFEFNQGSIDNNKAKYGGGVLVFGAMVMTTDAVINNNSADNDGGGIFVRGSLNMSGGKIYENIAYNGAGVFLSSGTMDMSDGEIYKNEATFGAGVYLDNATMDMSGGTIYENKANIDGGGIALNNKSILNMSAGEIYKNTAGQYGGGVDIYRSTMNITGGSIYSNTATTFGGGIDFYEGELIIGDTAEVTGNVKGGTISEGTLTGGTTNNIGIAKISGQESKQFITFASDFSGSVGITAIAKPTLESAVTISTDSSTYTGGGTITSDSDNYEIKVANTIVTLNAISIDIKWSINGTTTTEAFAKGSTPSYTGTPTKESSDTLVFTFDGWVDHIGGDVIETLPTVTSSVTYLATFTSSTRYYKVTFGGDSKIDYQYGNTIIAPVDPTKTATAEFTYTFVEWNTEEDGTGTKFVSGDTISGSVKYYAIFSTTTNQYDITFDLGNNESDVVNTWDYGTTITAPANPTKTSDSSYFYDFAGWYTSATNGEKVEDFGTVSESVTYYAQFTSIDKITAPTADSTTFTYSGNEQTYTLATSDYYTISNNTTQVNADTYTITVALNSTTTSRWSDATTDDKEYTFEITQATNSITGLTLADWTYDETASTPDATADFGTIAYTYSDSENGTYSSEVPTDFGTYYIKASVEETDNYQGATATTSFDITQATNSITDLTIADWTYDETASTPSATADFGTIAYTYSDSENGTYSSEVPTDFGTYYIKASVEETDNYQGATATTSFDITQATNSITDLTIADWTYGETASTPSATADFGTIAYTYSDSENGTYSSEVPTDFGTYYVKASVEETDNYQGATATTSFDITQATNSITDLTIADWTYGETASTPSATADFGTIAYTYSDSESGTYSSEVPTDFGTYYVKASVEETDNYQGATATTSFEISKADTIITTTEVVTNYTYTGVEQIINSGATINHTESTIVYSDNTFTNVGTGTYTIKLDVAESANYNSASTTLTISVAKAKLTIVADNITTLESGKKLTYTISGLLESDTEENALDFSIARESGSIAGKYAITITATADNYELDITNAVYTIMVNIVEVAKPEPEKNEVSGSISSDSGIDPTAEIILKQTETEKFNKVAVKGKNVYGTYDVALFIDGVVVEKADTYKVKMALPNNIIPSESYSVVMNVDGTQKVIDAVIEDGYLVFETDKLGEFALLQDNKDTLLWLIILLLALNLIATIYIVLYYSKKRKGVKTMSIALPLMFCVIAPTSIAIVAVLGAVLVGQCGFIALTLAKDKKAKAITDADIDKDSEVTLLEEDATTIAPCVVQESEEAVRVIIEEAVEEEVIASTDSEVVELEDVDDEDAIDSEVFDAKLGIVIRYNKSFKAKLIQSDDTLKAYYGELKNIIMSNKKVNSRVSWACESYNRGRDKLAKFAVRGKTLYVYLALDPNDYIDSNIIVEEAQGKRYEFTPCLIKIKNPKRFNGAKYLLEKLSEKFELVHIEREPQNYYLPYETTEALIEQKLIKELISKETYDSYQQIYNEQEVKERSIISNSDVDKIVSSNKNIEIVVPKKVVEITDVKETISVTDVKNIKVNAKEYIYSEINKNNTVKSYSKRTVKIINIDTLDKVFAQNEVVSLETLKEKGVISKSVTAVKILARGNLSKSLQVYANEFSEDAIKMIILTGGQVIKTA